VANVRERDCVVCVPLKWVLTTHTEIPEIAPEEVPGFLQLEAERGFHADTETLFFATSQYMLAGKQQAALMGIPRAHVDLLEKVLRIAKLRPLSFSVSMPVLQPPMAERSNNVLALMVGESSVGLQITSGGGIAALRALENALETEGGRRVLHADVVAREARITLGQLPTELREQVKLVRIFGPRDFAQQLADELELKLESMALKVAIVRTYATGDFSMTVASDAPVSPAFSFGVEFLTGQGTFLEFLPPKIPAWKQFSAKYGTGKARKAIAVAAAVAVILLGLFAYQQVLLTRWQTRWKQMSTEVAELKVIKDKIDTYRPWADKKVAGLTILRQITMAFPDDGTVTAKTLEIRDLNTVVCSGVARSMQSLVATQGVLQKTDGIAGVKVTQIRGHSPNLQFTLNIQCKEGALSAN